MTELCDKIVADGFRLTQDCYYNGSLRSEYRELQVRFPRVVSRNPDLQSLDEYASSAGMTENDLRNALLNHTPKSMRESVEKQYWKHYNFIQDVKEQMLTEILDYYDVDILSCDAFYALADLPMEQIESDYLTIFQS